VSVGTQTGFGRSYRRETVLAVFVSALLIGCQPTVKVEAPKEPITINLNVKIEHEVRVKVDQELDSLFEEDPELF
jgi:hypothetical protein